MVTRFERDRVIQAHILPRQSNLNSAWTRIYNTRYIYACIESNTKAAKPTARKAKAKNLENPQFPFQKIVIFLQLLQQQLQPSRVNQGPQ